MDKTFVEEKKQRIINNIKQLLQSFVDNGGILEDLTIHDDVYKAVKNIDIYVDGKRLNLEERFAYFGFPRKPQQKPFNEKIKEIKAILDKFVEEGGNVNDLKPGDKIYDLIRNFTPKVNGKKLTTEEKFERMGHPRKSKYEDMDLCLQRLSALKNYQDENGYVDSYRKDEDMKQFISYCSGVFGFPPALVICLLADQKLQNYVVYTNKAEFLKTALTKYLETHKDFYGIKRNDPRLYNLLCSTSKTFPSTNGRKITNLELIEILGFENVPNAFQKETPSKAFSEQLFIDKYTPLAKSNNACIAFSDLDPADNTALSFHLRRIGETKSEFFARYNITFLRPRIVERDKRVILPEYPYLEEMREKIYRILSDVYKLNPELEQASAGDAFALKADVIKSVYEEYKHKIESKYILPSPEESKAEKQQ